VSNKRADLCLSTDLNGVFQHALVDIMVSSIHVASNQNSAYIQGENGLTERKYRGVADAAEKTKEKNYAIWDHENTIRFLALDSAGCIADKSTDFINDLYARNDSGVLRRWVSDDDRCTCKKWVLDRLSMAIAK
jgi:hypothetical protein